MSLVIYLNDINKGWKLPNYAKNRDFRQKVTNVDTGWHNSTKVFVAFYVIILYNEFRSRKYTQKERGITHEQSN